MPTDYSIFDEARLNALKDNQCGYQYCPRCRDELEQVILDGLPRLRCRDAKCGFVYYQNPVPAAGAIVIKDDRILLVKRAHPPRIGWWCIPAGFMEWKEHPEQTAVRELQEETGLDVRLESLFEVYSGDDDPRVNALLVLYLAKEIGGELSAADDAMDVRYFGYDELPDRIAFASHIQALADYNQRNRHPE
jgi:8-oxo-dGTP diphosphatase